MEARFQPGWLVRRPLVLLIDLARRHERRQLEVFTPGDRLPQHLVQRVDRLRCSRQSINIGIDMPGGLPYQPVDDPKAYTKPWTVKLRQQFAADTELIDEICAEGEKFSKQLARPR